MTTTARSIGTCVPLLLGLVFMWPVPAQSAAKSLKDQLVGHWQLVSVTVNGGTPYGTAPQGSMFLDAAGHLSVIVISDGGARNVAYFGSYTLDEADKSMSILVDHQSPTGVMPYQLDWKGKYRFGWRIGYPADVRERRASAARL